MSRRERTDRLRRASDGLASGEPVPTRSVAPRERLLSGPSLLYFTTVSPTTIHPLFPLCETNPSRFCTLPLPESSASLPSARKADSPLHVSARNFLPLFHLPWSWPPRETGRMNIEAPSRFFGLPPGMKRFSVCFNGTDYFRHGNRGLTRLGICLLDPLQFTVYYRLFIP